MSASQCKTFEIHDDAGIAGGTDTVFTALAVAAAIVGVALLLGASWLS